MIAAVTSSHWFYLLVSTGISFLLGGGLARWVLHHPQRQLLLTEASEHAVDAVMKALDEQRKQIEQLEARIRECELDRTRLQAQIDELNRKLQEVENERQ